MRSMRICWALEKLCSGIKVSGFCAKAHGAKPQRRQERRRQGGWALPAQDRTSIYIDDLAGHEVGQVRSNEENRAGNFLRGGSDVPGNDSRSHLPRRFPLEKGNGSFSRETAG